jgi:flagellin
MRAEIGGLTEGTRNAEQALDLLRTAEGGLNEVSAILIRMRELATQASTSTYNDLNREALDAEFNQLKEYIDRIAKLARYNEQSLLSGFGNEVNSSASTALTDTATGVQRIQLSAASAGLYTFIDDVGDNTLTLGNGTITQTIDFGSLTVGGQLATGTTLVANFDRLGIQLTLAGAQVQGALGNYADGDLDGRTILVEAGTGGSFQLGSDAVPADRLEYDIPDITVDSLVVNLARVSIVTHEGARAALAQVDQAVERVARVRGELGAVMNRLEYTLDFTANAIEHVNASESTVRDADFAWESSHLARNEILRQTTASVFAKAQVSIDMVMGLLTRPL